MNKKIILIVGVLAIVVALSVFLEGRGDVNMRSSHQTSSAEERVSSSTNVSIPDNEKTFSMNDIIAHSTENSCYTIIDGSVYDLTLWINEHPGGAKAIIKLCGIDGTASFTRKHGMNQKAKDTLEKYKIGILMK